MAKKSKKAKVSVPVTPEVVLNPVQKVEKFLNSEGLQVFVNVSHKQLWRCKLVHIIAKALNVTIFPAVREVPKLPTQK